MKHPTGYACKECGLPVTVKEGGEIVRTCSHTGTVIMLLDCELSASGGLGERNPLLEAFRRIGIEIMRRIR